MVDEFIGLSVMLPANDHVPPHTLTVLEPIGGGQNLHHRYLKLNAIYAVNIDEIIVLVCIFEQCVVLCIGHI